MKLNKILPAVLAAASFPFTAHAAQPSQDALAQLQAGAPAVLTAAPVPQAAPDAAAAQAYADFYKNADAAFDAAAAARLRDAKVLLIPGFLSDVKPDQFHIPFLPPPAKGYFGDQMDWLKGLGVENERLDMKSESSVQVNAALIAAAINASAKPVIIIAHSKGGLDTRKPSGRIKLYEARCAGSSPCRALTSAPR